MASANTQKHPKGLYLLFFTEMWERFSYYGMRAIFTLFMVNALLFDKSLSSVIYGSYTGLVYLTPLIGGYVADKYWGNRRSILAGGILMAIGQFFMFMSGSFYTNHSLAALLMFVGLGFLIFGNGFFKPNISTMVGQLYPEGDKRVDSAFTIFYMGINLGAFIAPLVCGSLGEVYDASGAIVPSAFKWGFLAAGIGMIVSTISFELLKNKYIVTPTGEPIGNKPKPAVVDENQPKTKISGKQIGFWSVLALALFVIFKGILSFDVVGAFIYTACIIAPASIITDKTLTPMEKQKIWVIFIIAFFVIFFWSAFEQAGASLTFFAQEQTNRHLFGKEIPASYFQSINAVSIVIFAPLFAMLWTWLGKRNAEPASPIKQAMGLFLLSVGYLVIALGVKDLDPSVKVSMLWLVTLYMIHTFGELCLSPIGLAMVVKLAPVRFASLLMGVWFLSTATANKFAGDLSALYPEEVKMEATAVASSFSFTNSSIDAANEIINTDSNFVKEVAASNYIASLSLSSDNDAKPVEPTFSEKFMTNLFGSNEKAKTDSLLSLKLSPATAGDTVSKFILKQIVPGDAKYHYVKFLNEDKSKLYLLKDTKTIEVWNLNPKKPTFVGFEIKDLYSFFMIFVVMAGIASIVLFFLSKKLLTMMHDVR